MIRLEEFSESDFDNLISWISTEEELIQFAGPLFEFPLSINQLKKYISDSTVNAFKVLYEDRHIGHAEINVTEYNHPKICRILIGDKSYRGKGLGQQMVRSLLNICKEKFDDKLVELNVYDWNVNAIKCYEKVGFRINKTKQKEIIVNGRIWRSINMIKEIK